MEISFHLGSLKEEASVLKTVRRGADSVLVASITPFHPVDYQWPDQPADRGCAINADGGRFELADAIFTALDGKGDFYFDREIPVRKGEPGWYFCVGHVLPGGCGFAAGDKITLSVDAEYRQKLSRAHSAAHVMALALNRVLTPLWRKEAPSADALGSPNFDGPAIQKSEIGTVGCLDSYRIGKSLRKKGFSADGLAAGLKGYEAEVNALLAKWLSADSPITIHAGGAALASRRFWRSKIDGADVEIPCGGTHLSSLRQIGSIDVALEMPDGETLTVVTSPRGGR